MIIVTISMIKIATKTSIFSDKNVEKFVCQGADFFGALSTSGTFFLSKTSMLVKNEREKSQKWEEFDTGGEKVQIW